MATAPTAPLQSDIVTGETTSLRGSSWPDTGKSGSSGSSDQSGGSRESVYAPGAGYRAYLISPDWSDYITAVADNAYNPINNIDDGTIVSDLLADASVTTIKLVDLAVTSAKLGNSSVIAAKVAANAIDTLNLVNDAVTNLKLAANAVASLNIQANAVLTTNIADNQITTPKLVANAVTANEIAANAVTAVKIDTDAVTAAKILAGAVTAVKINVASLSAITADLGAITAGTINAVDITGGTIIGTDIMTDNTGNNRVTIDATNGLQLIDSGNVTRVQLNAAVYGGMLLNGLRSIDTNDIFMECQDQSVQLFVSQASARVSVAIGGSTRGYIDSNDGNGAGNQPTSLVIRVNGALQRVNRASAGGFLYI